MTFIAFICGSVAKNGRLNLLGTSAETEIRSKMIIIIIDAETKTKNIQPIFSPAIHSICAHVLHINTHSQCSFGFIGFVCSTKRMRKRGHGARRLNRLFILLFCAGNI